MLMGSIFERHGAEAAGLNYSTGTATFTQYSAEVVGSGTSWTTDMEGGAICLDADEHYYPIFDVVDTTHLTLTSNYAYTCGSGAYTMKAVEAWAGKTGENTLEYLVNIKHVTYQEGETGALAWVTPNPDYFSALWKMFTWDFTFLRGTGYEMVRWIVLMPFSIAAVFGMIMLFIQVMQGFIHL